MSKPTSSGFRAMMKRKMKKPFTRFRDTASTLVNSIRSKASSKNSGKSSTTDTRRPSDTSDISNDKREISLEEYLRNLKLKVLFQEKANLLAGAEEEDWQIDKAREKWRDATDTWSKHKGFITHGWMQKARLRCNELVMARHRKQLRLKEIDVEIEVLRRPA